MFSFNFLSSLKFINSPKRDLYKSLKSHLNFIPKSLHFYELAFIHKSSSAKSHSNNERLEYLGDAVLDAVVADYLFNIFPKQDEGFLTKMRSKIVNREQLSNFAFNIGLDAFVKIDKRVFHNRLLFGDAFEAFIGAMYLDKGYEKTKQYIIYKILKQYINLNELKDLETNHKSALIEWCQKHRKEIFFNCVEDSISPPKFTAQALVDNQVKGTGKGASKKEAEQHASEQALTKI